MLSVVRVAPRSGPCGGCASGERCDLFCGNELNHFYFTSLCLIAPTQTREPLYRRPQE